MMETLNLAGIVEESIVDGPGVRFVLFVQGCPHHCKGCHNPDTHSFEEKNVMAIEEIYQKIRSNPLVRGVTFSGGEPFCQAGALATLGERLRADGYDVFLYSGYTMEILLELAEHDCDVHRLLCVGNYLVDGPFVEEKRDLRLKFRGSINQNIYDITCYPNSKRVYVSDEFKP